ncbi:CRISPR-associated protein Cas4 [Sphingobacterium sp. IITKGP-BTPF85]|uniref:CRISPR-associated protein Cas4 n=1 Tax=Sphingobacterium sp. IITKGP-BTPF85 TaxID=1338009 RepID=UPI000389F9CF|nr:CRISPR-associated protein Cas4 [Sphingobacterium sp. IITKGP-BTPF85]KKX47646.1 CRISPR-associated protein Cas4 [Sphingobacterium sp. IITKGP-BTPF85]
MQITGTHIAYLHTCHRKLWLFANGIQMEHTSETVAEGKLISETTYLDRSRKYTELAIDGIKIDFYDAKNKVIHEVKKSNKVEQAHLAQVKYYMYILSRNGVHDPSALLEYPKLKQRDTIHWNDEIMTLGNQWENEALEIITQKYSPPLVKLNICKNCSYYEFCFIHEDE